MSTIDNAQTSIEKPQPNVEKSAVQPIVDLSDAQAVRQVFGNSNESKPNPVGADGHITFNDPYKEDGQPEKGQSVKDLSDASSTASTPTNNSDVTTSDASTGITALQNNLAVDQQLLTDIVQIEQGIQQVVTEITQLFSIEQALQASEAKSGAPATTGSTDTTSAPSTTAPNDGTPTNPSTTSSENTSSSNPATNPSDSTPSSTTTKSSGDNTSTTASTSSPSDNTSTTASTSSSSDSTSTTASTTPTDGSSATSTTSSTGDTTTPISDPAAKPTSSDPLIADMQWSDPSLAKVVEDASKTMSASGYANFESKLSTSYTGGKNDFNGSTNYYSGNANFNDSLMQHALSGDGLSTADKAALTSVLQSDMPAALSSDSFVASIQQSSPEMAKALTDASTALSKVTIQNWKII